MGKAVIFEKSDLPHFELFLSCMKMVRVLIIIWSGMLCHARFCMTELQHCNFPGSCNHEIAWWGCSLSFQQPFPYYRHHRSMKPSKVYVFYSSFVLNIWKGWGWGIYIYIRNTVSRFNLDEIFGTTLGHVWWWITSRCVWKIYLLS